MKPGFTGGSSYQMDPLAIVGIVAGVIGSVCILIAIIFLSKRFCACCQKKQPPDDSVTLGEFSTINGDAIDNSRQMESS